MARIFSSPLSPVKHRVLAGKWKQLGVCVLGEWVRACVGGGLAGQHSTLSGPVSVSEARGGRTAWIVWGEVERIGWDETGLVSRNLRNISEDRLDHLPVQHYRRVLRLRVRRRGGRSERWGREAAAWLRFETHHQPFWVG
jgi:hypothetical protein